MTFALSLVSSRLTHSLNPPAYILIVSFLFSCLVLGTVVVLTLCRRPSPPPLSLCLNRLSAPKSFPHPFLLLPFFFLKLYTIDKTLLLRVARVRTP